MPFSVIKECLKTKKTTGIFKVFRKKLPKCLSEKKKFLLITTWQMSKRKFNPSKFPPLRMQIRSIISRHVTRTCDWVGMSKVGDVRYLVNLQNIKDEEQKVIVYKNLYIPFAVAAFFPWNKMEPIPCNHADVLAINQDSEKYTSLVMKVFFAFFLNQQFCVSFIVSQLCLILGQQLPTSAVCN